MSLSPKHNVFCGTIWLDYCVVWSAATIVTNACSANTGANKDVTSLDKWSRDTGVAASAAHNEHRNGEQVLTIEKERRTETVKVSKSSCLSRSSATIKQRRNTPSVHPIAAMVPKHVLVPHSDHSFTAIVSPNFPITVVSGVIARFWIVTVSGWHWAGQGAGVP